MMFSGRKAFCGPLLPELVSLVGDWGQEFLYAFFFFKNWHYNIEETLFPQPLFQELIGRTPCVLSSCIGCRRAQGCDGESPAWARLRDQRGDLLLRI